MVGEPDQRQSSTACPKIWQPGNLRSDRWLQTSCYALQEAGRRAVIEAGAVVPLTRLLHAPEVRVHARAAGALHNLSSHPEAVRLIRLADGIPCLVQLLRSASPSPSTEEPLTVTLHL